MTLSAQLAQQFRSIHFGNSFTGVHLQTPLSKLNWEQATTRVHELNTIAALVFHINYYVDAQLNVLRGNPLDAHDKYSYHLPPIRLQTDWEKLLNKMWTDAEDWATRVEQMPEEKLWEGFSDGKYGTYFRNFTGLIEHSAYHMGQIVLIRKILLQQK